MEQCGCVSTFAQTLDIFIQALAEIPLHLTEVRALVGAGLRVYLHRMVVCLGDQILQHFGPAARELLRTASGRDLTDFLPLLNQIMIKYKVRVVVNFLGDRIEASKAFLASDLCSSASKTLSKS